MFSIIVHLAQLEELVPDTLTQQINPFTVRQDKKSIHKMTTKN